MANAAAVTPRPAQSVKSKLARTRRRVVDLRLLAATFAILAVAAVAGYFWYQHQSRIVAAGILQRAKSLEEKQDWNQAANYLNHYLQIEPLDVEVRLRLIGLLEKSADTRGGASRLVSLLYQTLGVLPDREDLRLKLAQRLFELQDFVGAATQVKVLSQSNAEDILAGARRVDALVAAVQARPGGEVTIKGAIKKLDVALQDNPADVTIAALAAQSRRQFPQEADAGAVAKADAIMDRLVAVNPKNVDALLARYRYRAQFDPQRAGEDLQAVLALDGDHVEALLLNAEAELATGDKTRFGAAEQSARRAIRVVPQDPRGYLVLSRRYLAEQDLQQAADVLLEGHEKVNGTNLELTATLSSLLFDLNRTADATRSADEFSKEFEKQRPYLTPVGRIKYENTRRVLSARGDLAENRVENARRELEAVVATAELGGANTTTEVIQSHQLLAEICRQQGRLDAAAEHWSELAKISPAFNQAGLKTGLALLELGRPEEAIEQLETYLKAPGAQAEAWLTLVQAHLQRQLALPAEQRNWQGFLAARDRAQAEFPNRWEWQLADVWRIAVSDGKTALPQVMERLSKISEAFPQDASLCEQLVVTYQQLGKVDECERILKRYDTLQPKLTRRAALRTAVLASTGRSAEALQGLTDAAQNATSPQEQRELILLRFKLLLAMRQFDNGQELIADLIKKNPTDAGLLTNGIEVALQRNDLKAASDWENLLKDALPADDFNYRYYRARLQLARFGQLGADEQAELAKSLETLRVERPGWPAVSALLGQYYAARGDRQLAIQNFEDAIDAGDRRPENVEQLVRLLYAEGRFDDASNYLSRLKSDQRYKSFGETLAIIAAASGNQLDQARELAQRSVESGSRDPIHHIMLANLLQAEGDQKGAEETFRKALQQFPQDARVWNALFSYFLKTSQPERARQVLDRWSSQVSMTEIEKLLLLGQGHEALGDRKAAQDLFNKVVDQDPKNQDAILLLAKSLSATDAVAARKLLDKNRELEASRADARRLKAALLAATGDSADWDEAVRLLQRGGDARSADASDDERLQVILLAQRGKNRAERRANYDKARSILTVRLERKSDASADVDRLLLAGIYEQIAELEDSPLATLKSIQSARDTLRPIVDRENVSADQLLTYIRLLLRHLPPLSDVQGANDGRQDLRASLADDIRLRVADLEQLLATEKNPDRKLVPLSIRMKLAALDGNQQEGLQLLDVFVTKQSAETAPETELAKLYLQAGNLCSSLGAFSAAEAWYRKLAGVVPNSYVLVAQSLAQQGKVDDAVRICLDSAGESPSSAAAVVLAQLLAARKVSPDLERQAQRAIDAALDADRANVDLLMSVAVLRITRDDNDEGIRLLQRVVEIEPRHTLALNNLATLLAERKAQLGAAQEYVERAIAIVGRQPALLDTLGTILLHSKNYDGAITALEESVAGTANDPRYYFHLAAAYDAAGKPDEAKRALNTAVELGLDKAILTSGDRELLATLKHYSANNGRIQD